MSTEPTCDVRQERLEDAILTLWKRMLGQERIGLDDDFFDLGGHSLQAIQIAVELRELTGADISTDALYGARTIRKLASYCLLAAAASDKERIGQEAEAGGHLSATEASPAPQHLEFLSDEFHDLTATTGKLVVEFDKSVDLERLQNALAAVAARHEALRMVLTDRGHLRTVVEPPQIQSCRTESAISGIDDNEALHSLFSSYTKGVIPTDGPLTSFVAVSGRDATLLLVEASHVVLDQHAARLLLAALGHAYSHPVSPTPPSHASEGTFTAFLREANIGADASRVYWRNHLRHTEPKFLSELDRTQGRSYSPTDNFTSTLSCTGPQLRVACRALRTSEFVFLLTMFLISLRAHSDRNRLLVSTTVGGRTKQEYMHAIGSFSSSLLFNMDVPANAKVAELLQDTSAVVSAAYQNLHVSRHDLYAFARRDDFVNFSLGPKTEASAGLAFPAGVFRRTASLYRRSIKNPADLTARCTVDEKGTSVRYVHSATRLRRDACDRIALLFDRVVSAATTQCSHLGRMTVTELLQECRF